jgi:hypothetical protein
MHEARDEVTQGVQEAWDKVTEKDTSILRSIQPPTSLHVLIESNENYR